MSNPQKTMSVVLFSSPIRVCLTLMMIYSAVEFGMMFILPMIVSASMPEWSQSLVDAGLMALVAGPITWLMVIRPLRQSAVTECAFRAAAIDAAADMILIVNRQGIIEYVNPSFTRLTGYTSEEAIGKTTALLKSGAHDKAFYRDLWATVLDGHVWRGEMTNRRKDGSLYPEEMSITPVLDGNGQVVRFVAIKRDVTEQNQAKELQRESHTLQASVAAMERILGVIAHELRTPLTGIRAMAEFLLLSADAKHTADYDKFIRGINDEVVRMAGMVNDLLEVARINSGHALWNWSLFPLAEACDQAAATVRPVIDASKVELQWDVQPPDMMMRGDQAAIRRLILNLLSNAQKHTPVGSIEVTARACSGEGGNWVEFQVRDTGAGMSPEIAAKLGEAFTLNSGMVGDDYVNGSGLGLAICRGIVGAHAGSMQVQSFSGKGTTVTVRLRADLTAPATLQRPIPIIRSVTA